MALFWRCSWASKHPFKFTFIYCSIQKQNPIQTQSVNPFNRLEEHQPSLRCVDRFLFTNLPSHQVTCWLWRTQQLSKDTSTKYFFISYFNLHLPSVNKTLFMYHFNMTPELYHNRLWYICYFQWQVYLTDQNPSANGTMDDRSFILKTEIFNLLLSPQFSYEYGHFFSTLMSVF